MGRPNASWSAPFVLTGMIFVVMGVDGLADVPLTTPGDEFRSRGRATGVNQQAVHQVGVHGVQGAAKEGSRQVKAGDGAVLITTKHVTLSRSMAMLSG